MNRTQRNRLSRARNRVAIARSRDVIATANHRARFAVWRASPERRKSL